MKTIDELPTSRDGEFKRIMRKKAAIVVALVRRGGAWNRSRKVRKWDHALSKWERREEQFWRTL